MALTDAVVQRARSRDKDYTLNDADDVQGLPGHDAALVVDALIHVLAPTEF